EINEIKKEMMKFMEGLFYYTYLILIAIIWVLIGKAIYNHNKAGDWVVDPSNLKVTWAARAWIALGLAFLVMIVIYLHQSMYDITFWSPLLFFNLSIYNIINWWKVKPGTKGIFYRGQLYKWDQVKEVKHFEDTIRVSVEKKNFLQDTSFSIKANENIQEIYNTVKSEIK
ncbi:MAG: DUF986 family protein, partial [Halanaerobiales bacterium]